MKERFPQIELILSSDNLGYGGGANLALRKCRADVAVVLNTDITVPPDWLMQLMAPMLADPQLGIAGCKLYYPGGRSIQHAGGYVTTPQAWPGHYGLNDEDLGQHDAIRDVDYVIGAALAVKRSVWEQIGLFDEGYFLYYEDVDYCQRAQRAGFRVVYIPTAWLTHLRIRDNSQRELCLSGAILPRALAFHLEALRPRANLEQIAAGRASVAGALRSYRAPGSRRGLPDDH